MSSEAEKKYIASKGWLTRAANKLGDILKQAEIENVELSDAFDEFDTGLAALDLAQSEVELH